MEKKILKNTWSVISSFNILALLSFEIPSDLFKISKSQLSNLTMFRIPILSAILSNIFLLEISVSWINVLSWTLVKVKNFMESQILSFSDYFILFMFHIENLSYNVGFSSEESNNIHDLYIRYFPMSENFQPN